MKLRLCHPGEEGSVISTYGHFGETESFNRNVTPAIEFLYGVEEEKDIPIYGNPELRRELQERYRQKYLQDVCPATPCGTGLGQWREMVGAAFAREIYAFRVRTTHDQDQSLVDEFNAMPNVNRYNGFTRNCADFTRKLVNRYFPGSARPDLLNDFGMTSPKAVAKPFANYGKKHPELEYSAERYTQVPGPIRRSQDNRTGTEVILRSKKWSIPMLIAGSPFLVYSAAAYYFVGRFNPEYGHEKAEQEAWDGYKGRFPAILARAVSDRVFAREKDVRRIFPAGGAGGQNLTRCRGRAGVGIGRSARGIDAGNACAAGFRPNGGRAADARKGECDVEGGAERSGESGGIPGRLGASGGVRTGASGRGYYGGSVNPANR